MDDTAQFTPEFNFYRNNIAAFPFRNDRLLYYLLSAGGLHQGFQCVPHLRVYFVELVSYRSQLR